MTVITAQEYREQAKKKKPRKYRNTPVVVDGATFDSKAESRYYAMLKLREKAGEVLNVEMQVPLSIIGPKGELICTIKPDFVFWDNLEKRQRYIDVKGGRATQTPVFKLKQKLARAFLGIEIEVETVR